MQLPTVGYASAVTHPTIQTAINYQLSTKLRFVVGFEIEQMNIWFD
jgi:hypothetical protein